MDVQGFRDLATAAFPIDSVPKEVVSPLAREIHDGAPTIDAALKGQPWTNVDRAKAEQVAKDIVALTVQAFVHYIPAFMCAALEDAGGDAATYAMYALCPLGSFDAFFEGTCKLFSPIQASVIASFLTAMFTDPSFHLFTEEMKPGIELWKKQASG